MMFPYNGNYGNYGNGNYSGGYVPPSQSAPNAPYAPPTQANIYTYVNGLEGAKAFFVPPNGRVLLMDSDNPVFYIKTANSMGQTTIRPYRFEEIQEQPAPKVEYVKQSDLTAFDVRIKRLEDILSGVKKNAEPTTEQQ